jgi:uncharacterized protein YdaU (DUF1376 family)
METNAAETVQERAAVMRPVDLPFMPLYTADLLRKTQALAPVDIGVFVLLVVHYWEHGEMPDDPQTLAIITKTSAEDWPRSYARAMAAFHNYQAAIDALYEKQARTYKQRVVAGKAGVNARTGKAH